MSGSSSTSKTNVPQWVTDAAKTTWGAANTINNAPAINPPSADQRVAGFNSDQTDAFSQLRDYVNSGGGAQGQLYTQGTGMISDPGSNLNPYVNATLQPTIRNINDATKSALGTVGDNANAAGAFGDARQGVLEGQVYKQGDQAIGDATSNAYSQAWQDAINRGSTLVGASTTGQNDFMTRINALLGTGQTQQQNAQSTNDVNYQNWQTQQQDPYQRLAAMVSTLSGVPQSVSSPSTTTTSSSSNPLFSILGSALGGLLK